MQRNDDSTRYRGWVEECRATTISGWAVEGDRPAVVTIIINGSVVANVHSTMVRQDVAATGGSMISGFSYNFAEPLSEGDEVAVVFPDGTEVKWACAKWGRAPASIDNRLEVLSPTQTAFASIQQPLQQILTDPLTTFSGWFAALDNQTTPDFYVNGVKQKFVTLAPRPDVSMKVKAGYVTGWSLISDLADLMTSNQHAITFEVRVGPIALIKKHYRCVFPCPDAPPKSLTFFIHIPKTAGQAMMAMLAEHKRYLNTACVYYDNVVSGYFEVQQFNALSTTAINSFDVVLGHYEYGLHKGIRRPYEYLTIMRDPFELLLSYYNYLKYTPFTSQPENPLG